MAGHNSTLQGGGFHHVAIKVADFDKTVRLYTEVFGFKEKIHWGQKLPDQDTRAIMLDTGDGNYLEIFAGRPTTPPPADGSLLHMAFRTADVDACIARVRAAGLEITVEPKNVEIPSTPPAPVRIAFCRGYDGETIEFFQGAHP